VFKAAAQFQLQAEKTLDEVASTSPAICGGQTFPWVIGHLYRIEETSGRGEPARNPSSSSR
jgi:hypothetical protein